YTIRGLASEPQDFAFFFTDKWQNHSDTLYQTITPLFEEKLSKDVWKQLPLDNDHYDQVYPNRPVSNLWSESNANFWYDPPIGQELPIWFTIDLGQDAVIGRMKVNAIDDASNKWLFARGSPKTFE